MICQRSWVICNTSYLRACPNSHPIHTYRYFPIPIRLPSKWSRTKSQATFKPHTTIKSTLQIFNQVHMEASPSNILGLHIEIIPNIPTISPCPKYFAQVLQLNMFISLLLAHFVYSIHPPRNDHISPPKGIFEDWFSFSHLRIQVFTVTCDFFLWG